MTESMEVIFSYTRKEAIDDGVLVDVSEMDHIFKWPVAITSALWDEIISGDADTQKARVWDVAYMSTHGRQDGPSDVYYKVIVGRRSLDLRCNVGPGDAGEPVVTIGFPADF